MRPSEPALGGLSDVDLVEQVVLACRILADAGYADLTLGHVSARSASDPQRMWVKRRGVTLGEVTTDDVISFDFEREVLADRPDMHLEAVLHVEAYRARSDVGAIVHGHPPYATALSATDAKLEMLTHDAVLFADGLSFYGGIPELITEPQQGRAVVEALANRSVVVLANHGVLVVEGDIPRVVLASVTLERALRLQTIASRLGEPRPIPSVVIEAIREAKYHDGAVADHWVAWVRDLRRRGGDHGLPG